MKKIDKLKIYDVNDYFYTTLQETPSTLEIVYKINEIIDCLNNIIEEKC